MSRLSKEELARYEGANWILDKIKAEGIEAAEKDLEMRGIRNIPLKVKHSDLHKFEVSEKANTIKSMLLISIYCIHDAYGFEEKELNEFINLFNKRAECLVDKWVSWKDIQQTMAEETGILIPMPDGYDMD